MSIFSEKWWIAHETGKFICSKCGEEMRFTDKWEDTLICPKCGYKVETDLYGIETEEEYDVLYPILPAMKETEENKKSEET